MIHSAIHGAREDAHCIMHVHTTAGCAVACKESGLRADNFYSVHARRRGRLPRLHGRHHGPAGAALPGEVAGQPQPHDPAQPWAAGDRRRTSPPLSIGSGRCSAPAKCSSPATPGSAPTGRSPRRCCERVPATEKAMTTGAVSNSRRMFDAMVRRAGIGYDATGVRLQMDRRPYASRRTPSAPSRSPPTGCGARRPSARSRTSAISGETHAARADPRAGAGQEGGRAGQRGARRARRRTRRDGDRQGRRRGARRQARRRVPARGLADRHRHPDQHERQRGARQPRQRAPRRRARRGAHGPPQRRRQQGPVAPTTSSPPRCTSPRSRRIARPAAARACRRCATRCSAKAEAFADIVKIGRTHLQDATPLTLGPGVLRLRGAARPRPRATCEARCRTCTSWRSAAPRSAPAQRASASSPSGSPRRSPRLTGLPFVTAPNKFEALAAARRAGPRARRAQDAGRGADEDRQRRALAGLRPALRPRRDHASRRTSRAARSCRARSTRRSARR